MCIYPVAFSLLGSNLGLTRFIVSLPRESCYRECRRGRFAPFQIPVPVLVPDLADLPVDPSLLALQPQSEHPAVLFKIKHTCGIYALCGFA
jgi:hypothetical protein